MVKIGIATARILSGATIISITTGLGLLTASVASAQPVDTVPPNVSIATPSDGATYRQGEVVSVDFTCTDPGGSGVASCQSHSGISDGGLLPTGEPGTFSFAVDGLDLAHNFAFAIATYRVVADPAITSAGSTEFVEGTAGAFTVTADGFPVPELSANGALPPGVTFNDSGDGTATLAGTPAEGSAGRYVLQLGAENSAGTQAQQFVLTVTGPGRAPAVVTDGAARGCTPGTDSGTFSLIVADPETPAAQLEVRAASSDQGLVRDEDLGLTGRGSRRGLTVVMLRGRSGRATITVTVSDGAHTASTSITVVAGSPRDDSLLGSAGPDLIIGHGGDDRLDGISGHDLLCGGDGADTLVGGLGRDRLRGGAGNDRLRGGGGNDTVLGGFGSDVVRGGRGQDLLRGGHNVPAHGAGIRPGSDTLDGGPGDDTLYGGGGADVLRGSRGDDTVEGGLADDIIAGGWGSDSLAGGPGADHYFGGPGVDVYLGLDPALGDTTDRT